VHVFVRHAAAFALLVLVGCQQWAATPLTPSPPRRPILPLPPAVTLTPPRLPREPARWLFTTDPIGCVARARARTGELRVTLEAGHPVEFALFALRGGARKGPTMLGTLHFEGAAGVWTALARIGPGRVAVTELPLNDQSVGQISLLLSGGILTPIGAGSSLPILLLRPASMPGRHWFACPRSLLEDASKTRVSAVLPRESVPSIE
jgi:hypothetical protein